MEKGIRPLFETSHSDSMQKLISNAWSFIPEERNSMKSIVFALKNDI